MNEAQTEALRKIAASLTRTQRQAIAAGTDFYAIAPNILPALEFYGLVDSEGMDWTPLGRGLTEYLKSLP